MGDIAIDPDMSDSCASTPEPPSPLPAHATTASSAGKRSASDAGLKAAGARPAKSVKRRASKACQCCRSRKVRCNVVEHGAPCTNCRLDEVECIVSESKRKKKWTSGPDLASPATSKPATFKPSATLPMSAAPPYEPLRRHSEHVPHSLYQDLGRDAGRNSVADMRPSLFSPPSLLTMSSFSHQDSETSNTPRHQRSMTESMLGDNNRLLSPSTPGCGLPAFIKPLPKRLGPDEMAYLEKKGALTMPFAPLRDELLRSYAEFVHPYLPLIDLHELVAGIDRCDGSNQVSLLVFQAIMFVGVANADQAQLERAGYASRRDARRDFFHRTRVLYDFDVELDRISLIQALLLMTHWYETPDDLKDSHHWMGIAVSLAHSIGLHRDLDTSTAASPDAVRRRRLWRRIWWSTYMRDLLIALGMRRPTRIKSSDFDVAMLSLDDFGLDELSVTPNLSCMPTPCRPFDDPSTRRQLAVMCIEKVRLCVAMSHVLSVQYSVLHNTDEAGGATRTTSLLAPRTRSNDPEIDEVAECDAELRRWRESLAPEARFVQPSWHDVEAGDASLVLNRSLLHMIYYATLSALHRPQVLPSSASAAHSRGPSADAMELSRRAVRLAASEITEMANSLDRLDLVRCMPTTGITVLMPAIIVHLLDIKASDEDTRRASLKGFCDCMQVMAKLRDMYAAADYSTAFLEAAIRKAEITLPPHHALNNAGSVAGPATHHAGFMHPTTRPTLITSSQGLVDAGRRLHLVDTPASGALTPPPDDAAKLTAALLAHRGPGAHLSDDADLTDSSSASSVHAVSGIRQGLHLRLAPNAHYMQSPPPGFPGSAAGVNDLLAAGLAGMTPHAGCGGLAAGASIQPEYEPDFDALINLDAAGDVWPSLASADADAAAFLPGGEGVAAGFAALGEVEWLKGLRHDEPGLVGMGATAAFAR